MSQHQKGRRENMEEDSISKKSLVTRWRDSEDLGSNEHKKQEEGYRSFGNTSELIIGSKEVIQNHENRHEFH